MSLINYQRGRVARVSEWLTQNSYYNRIAQSDNQVTFLVYDELGIVIKK